MDTGGLVEKRNRAGTRYFEDEAGEIVAKECSKCGSVKELAEFSRHKKGVGGKRAACKVCLSIYNGEQPLLWRGLTGKRNRKGTLYFESSDGSIIAKACGKCSEIKELAKFRQHKCKLGGCESACKVCEAETSAAWRAANKERKAETTAAWRAENKERIAARCAKYRATNKERIAASVAAWARNNPDKVRLSGQRRRARKKALPDTLTAEQYAETMLYFGGACALTGETTDLHQEHAIPLSSGHGGTIRENMYPMVGRLNISKGDRNIFEWFEANRQRFELSQERFNRLIDFLASANAMTVEEYREYVYWCHANPNEELAQ